MQKATHISGYCPYVNQDVTIKVVCQRYDVTGSVAYASVYRNDCEHKTKCPYRDNCPVEEQELIWNQI